MPGLSAMSNSLSVFAISSPSDLSVVSKLLKLISLNCPKVGLSNDDDFLVIGLIVFTNGC